MSDTSIETTPEPVPTVLERAVINSTQIRPRTQQIYRAAVRSFVAFAGDAPAAWTPARVLAWRDSLSRRGLSPQSANLQVRSLQFASRQYAATVPGGIDFAKDARPLAAAATTHAHKVPLTVAQVRKMLATCGEERPIDRRDRALILLGFRTGLRRTSITSIQIDSLQGNVLTVATRAGNSLQLQVDPDVCKALRNWKAWLRWQKVRRGPLFRALARPRADKTISVSEDAISVDGISFMLRERAKAAGITEAIYPDVFRYTFEAWCAEAGIEAYRVKAVTGAKTPSLLAATGGLDAPIGAELPRLVTRPRR
jgi:integrase